MNAAGRRAERRRLLSARARSWRKWRWHAAARDREDESLVAMAVELSAVETRIAELDAVGPAEAER